jgi:predicted transcriptional regulator
MTIIERTQPETTLAPLSTLVSLKDTSFFAELPTHATRDLNTSHVQELVESDPEAWPELKVVEVATEQGTRLAVIDGYHRWKARYQQVIIDVLGLQEATPAMRRKALEDGIAPDIQEKVNALLNSVTLPVEIGIYPTIKAVGKAALTANLKHGLAPSGKARVFIALDLYDVTRGETPEPSQAEIARMVGIARATLNEYLKKREAEQKKSAEKSEESEGMSEAEKITEKALRATHKLINTLNELYTNSPEGFETAINVLFPYVNLEFIGLHTDHDDKTVADVIRRLFETSDDVSTSDMAQVTRLQTIYGLLKKPSAKSVARPKKQAPEAPAEAPEAPANPTVAGYTQTTVYNFTE